MMDDGIMIDAAFKYLSPFLSLLFCFQKVTQRWKTRAVGGRNNNNAEQRFFKVDISHHDVV
jgi:uncharacterized membrane protein YecN with MAPEG domain